MTPWLGLLALSLVLVAGFEAMRLPAALLLGTMVAAMLLAAAGGGIRVPLRLFHLAQGLLGCLIARGIPLSTLAELMRHWPSFLAGIASVVAACAGVGWLMAWRQILPGTLAVWGTLPGAATAMVLMAEAFGADIRLVAVMQYLRVVVVVAVASLVARLWLAGSGPPPPAVVWFPPLAGGALAQTLALAVASAVVARRLRIPAGPMLLSLVAGVALQGVGVLTIELPPWLLAVAYAMVGWSIGLRFTRPVLVHAGRLLPRMLAAILAMIAACAAFGALLTAATGLDPLTAYLATSPGGADSVAIIAASTTVDLSLVMAMQTGRFLTVLLLGPVLARVVAGRVARVFFDRSGS